jgi:hypothetical protein
MVETYKDHLIVASANLEEGTGEYISVASISWKVDGKRQVHFLQSKERYDNADSAMHFALAAAKNWIDG